MRFSIRNGTGITARPVLGGPNLINWFFAAKVSKKGTGNGDEFEQPMDWLAVESVIGYESDDPLKELFEHLA